MKIISSMHRTEKSINSYMESLNENARPFEYSACHFLLQVLSFLFISTYKIIKQFAIRYC